MRTAASQRVAQDVRTCRAKRVHRLRRAHRHSLRIPHVRLNSGCVGRVGRSPLCVGRNGCAELRRCSSASLRDVGMWVGSSHAALGTLRWHGPSVEMRRVGLAAWACRRVKRHALSGLDEPARHGLREHHDRLATRHLLWRRCAIGYRVAHRPVALGWERRHGRHGVEALHGYPYLVLPAAIRPNRHNLLGILLALLKATHALSVQAAYWCVDVCCCC